MWVRGGSWWMGEIDEEHQGECWSAYTSQRCKPSFSPCTCSETPLLSCSAWRSLNDLQISLIFQGSKPFRVLHGRMVSLVLTLFVCFFFCYPPVDNRWTRKQQRRGSGTVKVTVFHSRCVWWNQSCELLQVHELQTHTCSQTQILTLFTLHIHF